MIENFKIYFKSIKDTYDEYPDPNLKPKSFNQKTFIIPDIWKFFGIENWKKTFSEASKMSEIFRCQKQHLLIPKCII